MKTVLLTVLMIVCSTLISSAQSEIKKGSKQVAKDVKRATKTVGRESKKAAKSVAKEFNKAKPKAKKEARKLTNTRRRKDE
jgi:hypothetical protein